MSGNSSLDKLNAEGGEFSHPRRYAVFPSGSVQTNDFAIVHIGQFSFFSLKKGILRSGLFQYRCEAMSYYYLITSNVYHTFSHPEIVNSPILQEVKKLSEYYSKRCKGNKK